MTDTSMACDKNFVMLVAEVDGTLVGFVEGRKFYEPANGKTYGISQHIYVTPEYRKTGVAPRLYRAFAHTMWKMGIDIISLVCVPGRKEFWARKGFKPTYMIFAKEVRKK
jgi:GNAT superfamily N-acetyltransferase